MNHFIFIIGLSIILSATNQQEADTTIISKAKPTMVTPHQRPIIINAKDAPQFMQKEVKVVAKVFGYKTLANSNTEVYLDAPSPNQLLTVVLIGESLKYIIDGKLGKSFTITGKVSKYDGKPTIAVIDKIQMVQAQ